MKKQLLLIWTLMSLTPMVATATDNGVENIPDPAGNDDWQLVWSDEFDGDTLDTQKWSYHPRYSSTWNRFVATGNERPVVNVIADGHYNAYCIATPDEFKPAETKPMISGAIHSAGKFYCTGGWIEARIKTNPHKGNFPAFWMMPTASETWPNGGEIDIWEQINTENISYHTIHSAWGNQTKGKPDKNSPTKSGTANVNPEQWHIYALEWDQDALKFYVDGVLKFTYANTHYSDSRYSEYYAWPFSKPFYIICNQSVGDGGWASEPDVNFVYHTEFDYVRVYQKKGALDYYSTADGRVTGITEIEADSTEEIDFSAPVDYYNIQGMQVACDSLSPGFYICRQGDKVMKKIVRH